MSSSKPANVPPPPVPGARPAAPPKDGAKPPLAARPAPPAPKTSGLSALASSGTGAAKTSKPAEPAAAPKAADGPISPRTIALVQASWSKVMPISDAAAALFYDRLFEREPSVRPLFKADISEQKKKLMQTLSVAVDGLSNLERLVPVLQALGIRHAGYMVAPHHYESVGEALLWTLREGLGDDFNSDVEKAWREVYTLVADVMNKAAAEHTGAAKPAGNIPPLPFGPASLPREQDSAPAAKDSKQRGVIAPAPTPRTDAQGAEPPPAPEPVSLASRTLLGVAAPGAAGAPPPAPLPAPPPPPQAAPASDGPLSPQTIALVQRSWAKVMPISDAAATLFYDRLFETDPSVRPLFKHDINEQKKKLMQTLSVAVDGLTRLDKLVPVLRDLGVRHAGYMVLDHHYDVVGASLLWTLREGLGDDFTPAVEKAWTDVYTLVADVMKQAAAEHMAHAAPAVKTSPTPAAPPPASPPPAAQRAPAKAQPRVVEEDADTLHYDSSRGAALPDDPHQLRLAADRVTDPPVTAANNPPAPAPVAHRIALPLDSSKEITLNVKLTLEGAWPAPQAAPRDSSAAEKPAAAPAADTPPASNSGGLAPALMLASLCTIASMALATLAPDLGSKFIPQFDFISPLAVPVLILVLTIASFGLGYLWGRPRASAGTVKGAGKA